MCAGVRGVLCVKECRGLGGLGLGTASGTQWVRTRDVDMLHLTKTWTVLNTCSPSVEKHCTNCDPTNIYKHECLPLTLRQEHFPKPLTLLSLVNTCSCLCLCFSSFSLAEQQLPGLLSSPTDPVGRAELGGGRARLREREHVHVASAHPDHVGSGGGSHDMFSSHFSKGTR